MKAINDLIQRENDILKTEEQEWKTKENELNSKLQGTLRKNKILKRVLQGKRVDRISSNPWRWNSRVKRSDPVKYERELALQRERRARKRENIQIGSDSKRVCFDEESGVLWSKTRSKYLQAISDGPIH
ncbi:hypothetical protein TNCV_875351 [Trichonephila clavipes]|nr:hypothetical protein TNCV_875351 [Trichonephila clavipes]